MNTRAWLRRVGLAALLGAMCAAGFGWVRLIYATSLIMKHERTLSMHAGGLIAHERRLREIEAMLGVRYPSGERRPKVDSQLADYVCSETSMVRRPRFLEVYARE